MKYTIEQIEKGEVRDFDLLMAIYEDLQEFRKELQDVADTVESRHKPIHS